MNEATEMDVTPKRSYISEILGTNRLRLRYAEIRTRAESDPKAFLGELDAIMSEACDAVESVRPTQTAEDHERTRSLVVIGVPESNATKPSERVKDDRATITDLLDELDVEATPIAVYRMGRPPTAQERSSKPRLLKVVMPSSTHQRIALTNSKRLKNTTTYKKVIVRPSMTKEERELDKKLRQAASIIYRESGKRTQVKNGKLFIENVECDPDTRQPKPVTGVAENQNLA